MDNGLVFSSELPPATIADRVRRGELTRIATGVYSTEIGRSVEEVVRAHLFDIAGRLLPGAVITDRSARTGAPVAGVLYLARPGRPRDIDLPGLLVRARAGAGPQPDDISLPGGLYLASRPRGLAENARPSRARAGGRRTLDQSELGDWVDYICTTDGPELLAEYRRLAVGLAPTLGVGDEHIHRLERLIGIALGTRANEPTTSAALAARRSGRPVDQARVRRFEDLAAALRGAAPQSHPLDPAASGRNTYEPFFEAYFSNFIEGTEFEVDEARQIVFDGVVPSGRPEDAHDVLGTYRLVADADEMSQTGTDPDEFIALVKRRNARIMEGRPGQRPGQFKELANRAGATSFVEPALVEGTLAAGFRLRDELDTAWEKALYVAFVVAEVHPFADGNGRTARVMMNAELHAGGQSRIIIPTVFRQDYLDGLRLLSRRDDPSVFIKAMRYAHDFTASIDFSTFTEAKAHLQTAHAFDEPDSAQRLRIRV
ncbi:Fic family protein [Nocardioides speluncae]|uniref:Fic family protein n=1 Tax=Nocardioides speluncae TaxID=2670337 RepID=UPI000D692308|nr:Fic family protein [Nocardioides speluncae]